MYISNVYKVRISIHAPARGAPIHGNPPIAVWRISIHAPARGATFAVSAFSTPYPIFQFTPLREGRLARKVSPTMLAVFQFTPLREGRPPAALISTTPETDFNSRPCERGDAGPGGCGAGYPGFQFTPLREGRPVRSCARPTVLKFQFTPLREGRPAFVNFLGNAFNISIHAPARGAT